jgi:DME family drug/metabolite transporter
MMGSTENWRITPHNRNLGLPAALLAGIFWSLAGLIYRWIDTASAWQVLFYRSFSLFVALLIWLLIRYRCDIFKVLKNSGLPAVAGGACLSLAFTGYILALDNTSVANAMFALAAAPFFTAILARILLKEEISRAIWFAMSVTAIGLIIMTNGELRSGGGLGNLFAISAALGFSGMTISLRSRVEVDMLPTILYASFFASMFSALAVISSGDTFILLPMDLGFSISLGLFQIGLGFLCFTFAARHLPAVELTLLSLTEIIVGPIIVWLGIGEIPSYSTLTGGAFIMFSIVIIAILGARQPHCSTTIKTHFS